MFAFIPLFVDFVRYLTFWHHMIQIYLTQKVCWLFCMFYMSLWNTWDIISPIEGIWLDVPLTRLLFIFLCYREKDNLCSLLGSTSACCCAFRGRSAGSFPEQRLVKPWVTQLINLVPVSQHCLRRCWCTLFCSFRLIRISRGLAVIGWIPELILYLLSNILLWRDFQSWIASCFRFLKCSTWRHGGGRPDESVAVRFQHFESFEGYKSITWPSKTLVCPQEGNVWDPTGGFFEKRNI